MFRGVPERSNHNKVVIVTFFYLPKLVGLCNFSAMGTDPISTYESEAIRRRLMVIRTLADGDNQAAFARRLGIIPSRWNNFERGMPLTMRMAFLLVKAIPDLTVSYITHGKVGDLPAGLRRQLAELENELFPSSRGKRSSSL